MAFLCSVSLASLHLRCLCFSVSQIHNCARLLIVTTPVPKPAVQSQIKVELCGNYVCDVIIVHMISGDAQSHKPADAENRKCKHSYDCLTTCFVWKEQTTAITIQSRIEMWRSRTVRGWWRWWWIPRDLIDSFFLFIWFTALLCWGTTLMYMYLDLLEVQPFRRRSKYSVLLWNTWTRASKRFGLEGTIGGWVHFFLSGFFLRVGILLPC